MAIHNQASNNREISKEIKKKAQDMTEMKDSGMKGMDCERRMLLWDKLDVMAKNYKTFEEERPESSRLKDSTLTWRKYWRNRIYSCPVKKKAKI